MTYNPQQELRLLSQRIAKIIDVKTFFYSCHVFTFLTFFIFRTFLKIKKTFKKFTFYVTFNQRQA